MNRDTTDNPEGVYAEAEAYARGCSDGEKKGRAEAFKKCAELMWDMASTAHEDGNCKYCLEEAGAAIEAAAKKEGE